MAGSEFEAAVLGATNCHAGTQKQNEFCQECKNSFDSCLSPYWLVLVTVSALFQVLVKLFMNTPHVRNYRLSCRNTEHRNRMRKITFEVKLLAVGTWHKISFCSAD